MAKEVNLAVSGLMFLVAIKSFEVFNHVQPSVMKTCDVGPRFAGSLIVSTLAVAMLVSLGLSFYYFKLYGEDLVEQIDFESLKN